MFRWKLFLCFLVLHKNSTICFLVSQLACFVFCDFWFCSRFAMQNTLFHKTPTTKKNSGHAVISVGIQNCIFGFVDPQGNTDMFKTFMSKLLLIM